MNTVVPVSEKVGMLKGELRSIAARLYLLEVASRAANLTNNATRMSQIEDEVAELIIAQDVFNEELENVLKEFVDTKAVEE